MPRPSLAVQLRSRRTLWAAWSHVRASARKSDSDQTKEAVAEFAKDAAGRIRSIYDRLRQGTFRFTTPKAVAVERDGKDPRPILIAHVDERVVQRALLDVLQETQAGELIRGAASYGAIPERGVRCAIAAVVQAIGKGATHYIRSDIGGFFQHIPRPQVISRIAELLPDRTLIPLLSDATEVDRELLKGHNVAKYRHLFPTPEVGMAQGGSLSAFFGNVAMEQFDELMTGDGVHTIRYVDDFIVLGPSAESVKNRFTAGKEHLRTMEMEVYSPDGGDPAKAACGETTTLFEFLGCEVSESFVRPDRASRERILAKVKGRLDSSLADLREGRVAAGRSPKSSITRTLFDVHNMVRSWSASYSFCNADQLLSSYDTRIDREISRYLAEAGRVRKKCDDAASSRRVLGVFPLADGKKDPIFGST